MKIKKTQIIMLLNPILVCIKYINENKLKFIFSVVSLLIVINSYAQEPKNNVVDSLGNKQGKWYFYNDSLGVLIETNYIDNYEDGTRLEYSDHGIVVREIDFSKGKKEGWMRHYSEKNGQVLRFEHYTNDTLRHILAFNKSGELMLDCEMLNNRINGKLYLYKRKAILISVDEYQDNVEHGKSIFYRNGVRETELTYDKGKLIGSKKLTDD